MAEAIFPASARAGEVTGRADSLTADGRAGDEERLAVDAGALWGRTA